MKGIQRNFKVQETVQVKELEESLEKIKTQMEEASFNAMLATLRAVVLLTLMA